MVYETCRVRFCVARPWTSSAWEMTYTTTPYQERKAGARIAVRQPDAWEAAEAHHCPEFRAPRGGAHAGECNASEGPYVLDRGSEENVDADHLKIEDSTAADNSSIVLFPERWKRPLTGEG